MKDKDKDDLWDETEDIFKKNSGAEPITRDIGAVARIIDEKS